MYRGGDDDNYEEEDTDDDDDKDDHDEPHGIFPALARPRSVTVGLCVNSGACHA